jgi:hypothetical protein
MKIIARCCFALSAALLAALAWPRPAPADPDMTGRWVVAQLTTTAAKVPVIGEINARTRVVALHDLAQEGDRVRGDGVLCRIDIDSGTSFVETKLPEAFKKSLPPPRLDGVLERGDDGTRFRTGRALVVVGAKLDKPDEPLPTSPRDPRVIDQDGDGKPGVTIVIDGIVSGKIYVAQRSWTRLAGKRQGDGSLSGAVYFDNEQAVLGATSSMLDDPPSQRAVPAKSWFKMVRVGKDATCADARKLSDPWLR